MKKNYSFSERLCKTFLLPALLILSVAAQAQDGTSCTDAIPLPVNNSCIYEEFSITDNEAYRWFDVTATGVALRISFTEPVDTPETHIHEVSFYEDSCGSLVLLAENSRSNGDTTADGRIAPLTVLGLTPGEDYHFSVSHQVAQTATCPRCIAPAPDTSYFRLCVEEIPEDICGAEIFLDTILNDTVFSQLFWENEGFIRQIIDSAKSGAKSGGALYKIPVVIHIIHEGEPAGTGSNLPDSQAVAMIDLLNVAFSNGFGSTLPVAADARIEFCLATALPNGSNDTADWSSQYNSTTRGITRIENTALTNNHHMAATGTNSQADLMNAVYFPPERYMNIWVVKCISLPNQTACNTLGYSPYPLTQGISQGQALDGVVMRTDIFTTNGTHPVFNEGKIFAHEAGHYLGMIHTFHDGCLEVITGDSCIFTGDLCCDTPPVSSESWNSCNTGKNTCSESYAPYGGPADEPDQVENYMDVAPDFCTNTFTNDQRDRMHAIIQFYRPQLVSPKNLLATGLECIDTGLIADFWIDDEISNICAGDTVDFRSSGNPPSTTLSWSWSFPGGNPSASTVQNPDVVYDTAGMYDVILTVADSTDTIVNVQSKMIFVNQCTPLASERGNWYFGNYAGVSFANGFAQSISDNYGGTPPNPMRTQEASAAVSNVQGNLLFYTDGYSIYDSTHQIMPGSTAGILECCPNQPAGGARNSAAQGVVIVPNPADSMQHYIFTVSDAGSVNHGLGYSIVDMSIAPSGELTAVVNEHPLENYEFSEHLAVIPHCNGRDYWVIVHGWETDPTYNPGPLDTVNDKWFAYLVDINGVADVPVVSDASPFITNCSGGNCEIGLIDVSPEGQRIVATDTKISRGYVFDFDRQSGEFSYLTTLDGLIYGVSFSPGGEVLYAKTGKNIIRQYDLSNLSVCGLSPPFISFDVAPASVTPPSSFSQLQRGPDDRMYISRPHLWSNPQTWISVINYPDSLNTSSFSNECGYNYGGVKLDPNQQSRTGLPNDIDAVKASPSVDFSFCIDSCRKVSFRSLGCGLSFSWDFGDGNTDTLQHPVHYYDSTGTYTVSFSINGSPVVQQIVEIEPPPAPLILGADSVCENNPPFSYTTNSGYLYEWEVYGGVLSNSNNQTVLVDWDSSGFLAVSITDANGCSNADTLQVTVLPPPLLSISTFEGCAGENNGTATATVTGTPPYTYGWSGGQTTQTATGLAPGNYSVSVSDSYCFEFDTFSIDTPAAIVITVDTIINVDCPGSANGEINITASGGVPPYSYNWSSGGISDTETGLAAGIYTLTVTDDNLCTETAAVTITEPDSLITTISSTPVSCFGANDGSAIASVSGGTSPYSYEWPSGGTSDTETGLAAGIYTVTVTDNSLCAETAVVTITGPDSLTVNITSTDVSCSGAGDGAATAVVSGGTTPYSYNWSSGGTTDTESSLSPGSYTVTATDNNLCTATASLTITEPSPLSADIISTSAEICAGSSDGTATVEGSGGTTPYTYLWSTGATTALATGLWGGTHTVTLTDANLCTATTSVTTTTGSSPMSIAFTIQDESCPGASDGEITASVSGGISPYNYQWDPPFPVAGNTQTGLSGGTYYVTATDNVGCTATDSAVVNTLPSSPSASFTWDPDTLDICMGSPVQFINTSVPPGVSWNWDFGDGNTSTLENPVHTYTSPGWHLVYMEMTNACGNSASASEVIYVMPSDSTYNTGCCSNTVNYHFDDLDITDITTKTQWNDLNNPGTFIPGSGHHIYIRGTLTIKPGAELWIQGGVSASAEPVYVEFGPNGKIIVERGALLHVAHHAYLTGLDTCGTMWHGVEVWGNTDSAQTMQSQGKVYLEGAGGIRDAHVGILAGRTGLCFSLPCSTPFCPTCTSPGWYHWNYGGGIVWVADAEGMIGNGVAVKFTPYSGSNIGLIRNTYVEGGILPDPGYTQGGSYQYPNAQNYLLAPATPSGEAPFLAHLTGVREVVFHSNEMTQAETGIEVHNGSAKIGILEPITNNPIGNTFNNFKYAIRGFTGSSNAFPTAIIGNDFTNFDYAIWDYNGQYGVIRDNEFGHPSVPQVPGNAGIYLENSANFHIYDNRFHRLWTGMMINSSGVDGGFVYQNNNPDGNFFNRVKTGIRTWNGNPALQLRCNTHGNPVASDYFRNWINQHQLASQGKWDPSNPSDTVQAGNEFDPNELFNPLKDIATLASLTPFPFLSFPYPYTYHRHSQSVAGTQSVTPDPIGPIFVNNTGIAKTPTSCAPCFTCKTGQFLDDKAAELAALRLERDSLEAALDGGGNTAALLGAVDSYRNNGQLKDLLLAYSPLSDTVLLAYLHREQVPAGHYKEVLIPNSPVSVKVFHPLREKLETLPKGIADQIREVQPFNPDYGTLTSIDREIEATHIERQFALSGMIQDTLNATDTLPGDLQAAIDMLEAENSPEADRILTGTYLETGQTALAAGKINAMQVPNQDVQDWVDLQNILLQTEQDTLGVFSIDGTQEAFIRQLAEKLPESPAVTNAKSILRLVFGEDFPVIMPEEPGTNKTGETPAKEQSKDTVMSIQYLGPNYPDPFQSRTYIPYFVPEEVQTARLRIVDARGKLIRMEILGPGNNVFILETIGWASGLYFYTIEIDGAVRQVEKMILTR